MWATVDEAGDAKIKEQIKAGLFPIRLSPEERTSGEILWLLDIVAPTKKAATAVLLQFSKIAGDKPVRMHPSVGRSVDADVLRRVRSAEDDT